MPLCTAQAEHSFPVFSPISEIACYALQFQIHNRHYARAPIQTAWLALWVVPALPSPLRLAASAVLSGSRLSRSDSRQRCLRQALAPVPVYRAHSRFANSFIQRTPGLAAFINVTFAVYGPCR